MDILAQSFLDAGVIAALTKFAKQQPGMALVVLASVILFAPKLYRHFRKTGKNGKPDAYRITDMWKYPSEWAPILILLTGLYIVATGLK